MTPPFPTVLFDLDGTLWDSRPGIVASLAHALAAVGRPVPDEATLASDIGPPLQVMLARFGVPAPLLDEARDAYRDRYRRLGERECELFPGVAELLDELRSCGIRLATATSKGVEPARRMLDHFGLTARFDVIEAASMDASAHHKVDVITAALGRLSPYDPARTAMVGDRSFDIEAGASLGLRTVGVGWGYAGAGELVDAGAEHLVATVDDLRDLLTGGT